MALGHGSKKSISCDQGVTPASLIDGVSNANTEIDTYVVWYFSVSMLRLVYVKPVELLE